MSPDQVVHRRPARVGKSAAAATPPTPAYGGNGSLVGTVSDVQPTGELAAGSTHGKGGT